MSKSFFLSLITHHLSPLLIRCVRQRCASIGCVFVAVVMCLQLFAGFEADSFAGRDCDLFACARVTSHATLARLDDEDAETSQLYSFAAHESFLHRMKKSFNGLLGFHFGYARAVRHTVHNV